MTVELGKVRPALLQCMLMLLADFPDDGLPTGSVVPAMIDPAAALVFWSKEGGDVLAFARAAWSQLSKAGFIDTLSSMTTPRLYGNKLRLTGLIGPIVEAVLPLGTPILDVMSGTGVVTRALSCSYELWTNDPNPYAALLSKCQGLDSFSLDLHSLIGDLREPYHSNLLALRALARKSLEQEASFLHCDLSDEALAAYAAFEQTPALPLTDGSAHGTPATMASERYGNVYFGIGQCIEIDSLRKAIDVVFPHEGVERGLALCALILSCTKCASGPHFAQPPKSHSLRAMRSIIEKRARSISWEFELALTKLAGRPPPAVPLGGSTQLDWRDALSRFVRECGARPAGVYADPPYSKLQHSRYYHVLNEILAYSYPVTEGSGRYPPRSARFSSRLEYTSGGARRELAELMGACAGEA